MLVVIGIPVHGAGGEPVGLTGTPALAAVAAARAGARVELAGKVGDDPVGDAVVLALGQQGVGHAALLRDPGHGTPVAADPPVEGASAIIDDVDAVGQSSAVIDRSAWPSLEREDLQLALRYLPDVRAIIVAEPLTDAVMTAVTEAASYLAAPVVAVSAGTGSPSADLVLAAPMSDPDGAFAEVLGQLGAALDAGLSVDDAFREVRAKLGAAPVST